MTHVGIQAGIHKGRTRWLSERRRQGTMGTGWMVPLPVDTEADTLSPPSLPPQQSPVQTSPSVSSQSPPFQRSDSVSLPSTTIQQFRPSSPVSPSVPRVRPANLPIGIFYKCFLLLWFTDAEVVAGPVECRHGGFSRRREVVDTLPDLARAQCST